MKLIISILILVFSIVACTTNENTNLTEINLIEIVKNPEVYDGKSIRIKVFASSGFENCVVYPSDPAESKVEIKYWIWYRDLAKECGIGDNALKSKYGTAIIEGIFDMNDKGHLGLYEGTIKNAKIVWLEIKKSIKEEAAN